MIYNKKKSYAPFIRTIFHKPSSGQGPVMGSCEHGNEPSSITEGIFLDQMNLNYPSSQEEFCYMQL
jgi:hypothetical protein